MNTVVLVFDSLCNLFQWFPGIENMTASSPGPMRAGKEFEETVILPAFGGFLVCVVCMSAVSVANVIDTFRLQIWAEESY